MSPRDPSVFRGGAGVIEYLLRLVCRKQLSEPQATLLWHECKTRLLAIGASPTVQAVEASANGLLDTRTRDDVLDAMAQVLTHQPRPNVLVDPEPVAGFISALLTALQARGYVEVAAQTSVYCEAPHANA